MIPKLKCIINFIFYLCLRYDPFRGTIKYLNSIEYGKLQNDKYAHGNRLEFHFPFYFIGHNQTKKNKENEK